MTSSTVLLRIMTAYFAHQSFYPIYILLNKTFCNWLDIGMTGEKRTDGILTLCIPHISLHPSLHSLCMTREGRGVIYWGMHRVLASHFLFLFFFHYPIKKYLQNIFKSPNNRNLAQFIDKCLIQLQILKKGNRKRQWSICVRT